MSLPMLNLKITIHISQHKSRELIMKKLITASIVAVPLLTIGITTNALADKKTVKKDTIQKTASDILAKNPSLDKAALTYALKGYVYAKSQGKISNPNYLTVVNFNKPDTAKRLNVIDLRTDKVVLSAHVAQGKGSGEGAMATHFSNTANSDATSLGTYVTGAIYHGKHGRSEHVIGIEKGINSNAKSRNIDIHKGLFISLCKSRQSEL